MNSVDVKNALETIVTLNPGLSKDKLVVLLKAANWEESNIDQALVTFSEMTKGRAVIIPALPHTENEHLLQEGKGETKVEGTLLREVRKKNTKENSESSKEGSLSHLPEGLPVKPFESSPHIITFSEYKEQFADTKAEPQSVPTKPESIFDKRIPVPKPPTLERRQKLDIHEPLSGADLSLVVVVSFLFLVIILLTGYMYSSGRLFN